MQILLRFLFVSFIGQSVAVLNNAQQDLTTKPTEYNAPSTQYLPSVATNNARPRPSADSTPHLDAYQYQGPLTKTANTITQVAHQYDGHAPGTITQGTQGFYLYKTPAQQNAPGTIIQGSQGPYQHTTSGTTTKTTTSQGPYQNGGSSQQGAFGTLNQGTYQYKEPSQQIAPGTANPGSYQHSGPAQQTTQPKDPQNPYHYRPSSQQNAITTIREEHLGSYQYNKPSQEKVPSSISQGNQDSYQKELRPNQQQVPQGLHHYNGPPQKEVRPNQSESPQGSYQYNGSSQGEIQPNQPQASRGSYQYNEPSQKEVRPSQSQSPQGSYQYNEPTQGKVKPNQASQGSYQYNGQSQREVQPNQPQAPQSSYHFNGPSQGKIQPNQPQASQYNDLSQENVRPNQPQASQGSYQYNRPAQGDVHQNQPQASPGSYHYIGTSQEKIQPQSTPGSYQYNEPSQGVVQPNQPQTSQGSYQYNGSSQEKFPPTKTQYNGPSQQKLSPTLTANTIRQDQQGPYKYNEPLRQHDSSTFRPNIKLQTSTSSFQQSDAHQYNSLSHHQLSQNTTTHLATGPSQNQHYNRPSQDFSPPQSTPGISQQGPKQYAKPSQQYLPPRNTPAPTTTEPDHYQNPRPSQQYLPPVLASNATLIPTTISPQQHRPAQQYLPPFPGNSNTQSHHQQSSQDFGTEKTQSLDQPTTTPVPVPATSSPTYNGPSFQYLPGTNATTHLPATQPPNSGNYFSNQHWTPIKTKLQSTTAIPQTNHKPVALHQGYRYNTPAQRQPTSHSQTFNGVIYNELGMGMNTSAANQYFSVAQPDTSGKTEIETEEGYSYGKPETGSNENPNSVTHLMPVATMPSSYIYYRPQQNLTNNYQDPQSVKQESHGNSRPSTDYVPQHSSPTLSEQYEGDKAHSNQQHAPPTTQPTRPTFSEQYEVNIGDKPYSNQQHAPPSTPPTRPATSHTINQEQSQFSVPQSTGNFRPSTGYISTSHQLQYESNAANNQFPNNPPNHQELPPYSHSQPTEHHSSNNPALPPARPANVGISHPGIAEYSHSQSLGQSKPTSLFAANSRPNENYIYHHPGAITNSETYQTIQTTGNTGNSPTATTGQNHQTTYQSPTSLNSNVAPSLQREPPRYTPSNQLNTNFAPDLQKEPPSNQLPPSQLSTVWNQSQGNKDKSPSTSNVSPALQTESQNYYPSNHLTPPHAQQTHHNSLALSQNSNSPSLEQTQPHSVQQFPSQAHQQPSPRPANYQQSNNPTSSPDQRPQVPPQQYNTLSSPGQLNQFRPSPQYNLPLDHISSQGNSKTPPSYQISPQQNIVQTVPQTQGNKPQFSQESQRYPHFPPQFSQQNFLNPSQSSVPLHQATEPSSAKYPSLPQTENQRQKTEGQRQINSLPQSELQSLTSPKQFPQHQQTFLAKPTTAPQVPTPSAASSFFGPSGHISGPEPNPIAHEGYRNVSIKPQSKPMTFVDTKTFIQRPSQSFELTPYFTMLPNNLPQGPPQQPQFIATQPPVANKNNPLPKPTEQKPMVFVATPAAALPKPLVFIESPIVPQEPLRQPHLQYASPVHVASNAYLPPSGLVQPPYYKK